MGGIGEWNVLGNEVLKVLRPSKLDRFVDLENCAFVGKLRIIPFFRAILTHD